MKRNQESKKANRGATMTQNELKALTDATKRAFGQNGGNWNPVYADIITSDGKVGHITSDAYFHRTWTFYPIAEIRKASRLNYKKRNEQAATGKRYHRINRDKPLDKVIPKWVGKYAVGTPQSYVEKFPNT